MRFLTQYICIQYQLQASAVSMLQTFMNFMLPFSGVVYTMTGLWYACGQCSFTSGVTIMKPQDYATVNDNVFPPYISIG